MPENNNVIFKTSTNKTINDLFNWDKSTGELTPNFDANEGVPFSSGTLYFTSDGHLIFDTQIKNKTTNQLENTRLWMSKNAYSAIYAEDITETNTDIANTIKYSIHYVEGPTTDTTEGTWTGTINGITELYDGLTIIYVPAVAGKSPTTTLNINGLGAKTCYYNNTSAITTHYSAGTPVLLTYRNNCWRRADYNSNTTYSAMSVAEMRTGTATSERSIRADYLKTFLSTLGGTNLTLTHSNSAPYLQLNHDPSGITAGTYGNSNQQNPSYGGTFNIPYFTVDTQGHITNASVTTVKIPESNNTDYKVRQTPINSNDNNNYRILLSNSANDTSEDSISKKNANLIYNPTKNKLSTGNLDLTGNINVVGDATFNNTTTIDNAILNSLLVSGNSSFVNNVNFTQIPTAPTATAGTNTTQIATTEFVTNAVAQGFVVNDAMVFKGLIGSNQLITQLPTSGYNAGWTYRVADAGIFAGEYCEVGDLLIAIKDGPTSGSSVKNTDWGKVEHNIDGAVFRGSDARNSSVGSSTQPVYVNGSGIVTAITGAIANDTTGNAATATTLATGRTLKVNLASTSASTAFNGAANITDIGVSGILPITQGGTGQDNIDNFVKVYSRSDMGNSINYDDPGVNGLFEARKSSEITATGEWPGGMENWFPLLSLKTSSVIMQIAGNSQYGYGWWIRGRQGANATLAGIAWERLVTNSGTWGINITGNATTATTAGGITSAGTTAQFWRGDNSWSNILAQPAETTLGIDTSDLRIGRAIRTLHIATKENGAGAGITEGDAAGITFGFSNAAYNAAYAGIYYQSSANYGSRLYFATTSSFGNGAYARMMITHDGKVGIHTTSPSTRLHVDGGVTVTDLTASQAVSTNANQKLVSTNLTTADPTASGTGISYIATISQSAVGKITATKSTIRNASTSQTGVLQFTSANTSAQINTLSTGSSVPYDDDYFISQYANGGISNTNYYRRPISTLYTYIKNKALANESDFLPNLKVNPITIKTVSGEKSYLDIETLLQWFITTEKISTSLQYHKTFAAGWEFASNDYLQFTYDNQNYEFNLAGTVIEFIGKTTGINETTNKVDGHFRLILHVPPSNPSAQTAGYVVPGYGSYIKYSVNGSGTNRSSKLTFINNRPQYYANEKIEYAASYNKTPEVANIKINGNTSAVSASSKNATITYNSTSECIDFIFN